MSWVPPTMTRELRLTSRRWLTYWGRALLAGIAIMACMFIFQFEALALNPALVGRLIFNMVALVGIGYCAAACVLTSDALSLERREGTLGLLFLTDLSAWEVLLGKFSVHGFASLYMLLGLAPALMLSLAAGGVTSGEVLRMVVVLFNSLFLALATGIAASAVSWHQASSIMKAAGTLAALCLVPYWLDAVAQLIGFSGPHHFSPLHAYGSLRATQYAADPAGFWLAVGATHLFAWAMLVAGAICLASNWRRAHQPTAVKPRAVGSRRLLGPARAVLIAKGSGRRAFAPVARALLRMRELRLMAWLGGGLCFAAAFTGIFIMRGVGSAFAGITVTLILALTGYMLFAMAAGRFLLEARQTGELELLLVTPLGARSFVREMRMALTRVFLGPIYLVTFGSLLAAAVMFQYDDYNSLSMFVSALTYLLNSVLQVLAVMRVCLCLAASAKNLLSLAAVTVGLVIAAPTFITTLASLLVQSEILDGALGVLSVVISLGFLRWAELRLREQFRSRDRSRFDRWLDWCGGIISGKLERA